MRKFQALGSALALTLGSERVDAIANLLPQSSCSISGFGQAEVAQWPQAHIVTLAVQLIPKQPGPIDVAALGERDLQVEIGAIRQQKRVAVALRCGAGDLSRSEPSNCPPHSLPPSQPMSKTWVIMDGGGRVKTRRCEKPAFHRYNSDRGGQQWTVRGSHPFRQTVRAFSRRRWATT